MYCIEGDLDDKNRTKARKKKKKGRKDEKRDLKISSMSIYCAHYKHVSINNKNRLQGFPIKKKKQNVESKHKMFFYINENLLTSAAI